MPRESKLRFWDRRQVYYCQIDGRRHYLGRNKKQAEQQFHALMASPPKRRATSQNIVELINEFLEFVQKNQAPDTYVWYRSRLDLFAQCYPDLDVAELKKIHVRQWIDSYNVAPGTKRNYARSIIRCLNWCEEEGIIDYNPLHKFKKPPGGKRERVLSDAEWQDILSLVPDPDFRDLLLVTWETGCRPQESLIVEARHVDLRNSRWVFPQSESKTDNPRVVYLTEPALEITKRRMQRHPSGPIFRNSSGKAWTTDAVNCAFVRIQLRMGLRVMNGKKVSKTEVAAFAATLKRTRTVNGKEVPKAEAELQEEARNKLRYRQAKKLAPKFCLYTIRHTWMNRMLTSGVDALTVAILAGHSDPSTLAKTYQHLSQNPTYMLEQAKRVG